MLKLRKEGLSGEEDTDVLVRCVAMVRVSLQAVPLAG